MTTTANFGLNLIAVNQAPYTAEVHANLHIIDAALAKYLSLNNLQGVWNNALAVTVGQRFVDEDNDNLWEVLVAHTTASSGTFSADRAAFPTYWQSATVDASFAGTWAAGTEYSSNQFVEDNSRYGVVTTAHTAVTSYDTGVTNGDIVTLVDASGEVLPAIVADAFVQANAGGTAWVTQTAAQVLATLSTALNSIAGLTTAADKMIYTTAANVYATTDLTSFGRDLLDDTSVAAQRTTLGLDALALKATIDSSALIDDKMITVAKIADGTDGELITWDASGVATTVAAGDAAQVLTSNGAGTAPTFQAAVDTGSWHLLQSETAAADATVTLGAAATDAWFANSTYKRFKVVGYGIDITNDSPVHIRFGTGATPTIDSTASYGDALQQLNTNAATYSGGNTDGTGTFMRLSSSQQDAGAPPALMSFDVTIIDPANTTHFTMIQSNVMFSSINLDDFHLARSVGVYEETTAVTAIQFLLASGSYTTGEFRLYGLKDA